MILAMKSAISTDRLNHWIFELFNEMERDLCDVETKFYILFHVPKLIPMLDKVDSPYGTVATANTTDEI
jgi:hypothetical protein